MLSTTTVVLIVSLNIPNVFEEFKHTYVIWTTATSVRPIRKFAAAAVAAAALLLGKNLTLAHAYVSSCNNFHSKNVISQ